MTQDTRDAELQTIVDEADRVLDKYRCRSPVPPLVYHYTSLDAAIKILETNTVWCSNIKYSNDPSEAEYGQKLFDQVLSSDATLNLSGIREIIRGIDSYVASFSAEGDLLTQWRAYCRNGRGVAIGVDFEVLRRRKSMLLTRVLYDVAEQKQMINEMLDVFRKPLLAAGNNAQRLAELAEPVAVYFLILRAALKSPAYESEHEYRLFDTLPDKLSGPEPALRFRVSGSALIPYFVADLTDSSAEQASTPIHEVRLGPCLDHARVQSAFDLFTTQHGHSYAITTSQISMRCD